ncbi:site-specific integrase [Paenibacillus polymyxa]|uniref:site-specific integrase n=1 Tax=Paenibacillus polymyxa TaxID=1406 RepID=UPI00307E1B97
MTITRVEMKRVMHADSMKKKQAVYLFESSWKKKYTDRGIRKILAKYSEVAGMTQNLSPHKLRHFLLTWLKKQGIDDALIQPYSGHESRKSLEVYSKLVITDAQEEYNEVIIDSSFNNIYFVGGVSFAGTTPKWRFLF